MTIIRVNGFTVEVVEQERPNITYADGAERGCHTRSTFIATSEGGVSFQGNDDPSGGSAWSTQWTSYQFSKAWLVDEATLCLEGTQAVHTSRWGRSGQEWTTRNNPVMFQLKRVS